MFPLGVHGWIQEARGAAQPRERNRKLLDPGTVGAAREERLLDVWARRTARHMPRFSLSSTGAWTQ